jgi:hypothetical protein
VNSRRHPRNAVMQEETASIFTPSKVAHTIKSCSNHQKLLTPSKVAQTAGTSNQGSGDRRSLNRRGREPRAERGRTADCGLRTESRREFRILFSFYCSTVLNSTLSRSVTTSSNREYLSTGRSRRAAVWLEGRTNLAPCRTVRAVLRWPP